MVLPMKHGGQWNLSIEAKEALRRGQLEFITPEKITGNYLNDYDLLYGNDQLWKASTTPDHPAHPGPDTSKPANLSTHNSGHFRHKEVPLWDPHPQYNFSAFGRHFQLSLELNPEFVSPKLKAHHVSPNATYAHAKPLHENVLKCYYTGQVVGDPESRVILNLCHGMIGSLRFVDILDYEYILCNKPTSMMFC
ncbi:hypothetical protein B566_EDAN003694 [Ephemera danica]|nr:hypothetical protein B566_EDAN003694 [Ephemera danica]